LLFKIMLILSISVVSIQSTISFIVHDDFTISESRNINRTVTSNLHYSYYYYINMELNEKLIFLIRNQQYSKVESILYVKVDLNVYVYGCCTALAEAIAFYNVKMVKLLIQYGADVNQLSLSMDRAAFRNANNHDLFPLVTPLNSAIRMLSGFNHSPLNEQDLIHLAAVEEIIQILLNDKNFNSDIHNEYLSTSLMVVAKTKSQNDLNKIRTKQRFSKRFDLVLQLIKKGIDINAQDIHGDTALITLFKQQGSIQDGGMFEKLLIESGININHQNSLGNTALIYSVENVFQQKKHLEFSHHVEQMEFLLKSGASVIIENNNGICPLYYYSRDLHEPAVYASLFLYAQTEKAEIESYIYNELLIPHELIHLIKLWV
jgi:ankyrin repeat protein